MDFAGPYPLRKYLMILIDESDRFPIVEVSISISFEPVIKKLFNIFGIHGMPSVQQSDEVPPGSAMEVILKIYVTNYASEFTK